MAHNLTYTRYMVVKTKIERKKGWGLELVISKYNNHPMLFMEWLADFTSPDLSRVLYRIRQVDDTFRIKLHIPDEEVYEKAAAYIDANSSD